MVRALIEKEKYNNLKYKKPIPNFSPGTARETALGFGVFTSLIVCCVCNHLKTEIDKKQWSLGIHLSIYLPIFLSSFLSIYLSI